MYDSRLGAAFTLTLPLFLAMIIVLQFSTANVDRTEALLPVSAEYMRDAGDDKLDCFYNRIEISITAFAPRDISLKDEQDDKKPSMCAQIKLAGFEDESEAEEGDEDGTSCVKSKTKKKNGAAAAATRQ